MKHPYSLFNRFTVRILLVSLCLQSCGGLYNLPINAIEPSEPAKELNNPDPFGQLTGKQLISKEGYAVTILETKKEDQLQAKVIENIGSLSRTHHLPVYIEEGINVVKLTSLNETEQKGLIHVVLLKDRRESYVYIGHTGLMGGMKRNDKGKEKIEEPKEKEIEQTVQNDLEAYQLLYNLAIIEKEAEAQFKLGQRAHELWKREGQKESVYQEAIEWYQKAAAQGHKRAIRLVRELCQSMVMEEGAQKKQEKRNCKVVEEEEQECIKFKQRRLVPITFGFSNFQEAIENGNIVGITSLLEEKPADVNKKFIDGNTPLHIAIKRNHIETVKLLLGRGAEVNAKDCNGNSPLHWAAEKGQVEVAKLLLEEGADVNAKDNFGYTPLQVAAEKGHLEIANLLEEELQGRDKLLEHLPELPVEVWHNILSYVEYSETLAERQINHIFYGIITGFNQVGLLGVQNIPQRILELNIREPKQEKTIHFNDDKLKRANLDTIPSFFLYYFMRNVHSLPEAFWPYLKYSQIRTLKFPYHGMGTAKALQLTNYLNGTKVCSVDLTGNLLRKRGLIRLANNLMNTQVKEIKLTSNTIEDETEQLLIKQYPHIKWIFLELGMRSQGSKPLKYR